MKKSKIIAYSLLLAGFLGSSASFATNGPKEATVTQGNETITLCIETKTENNHTSHNVMTNGNWVANADQDCNINAYKVFYDADEYCGKISLSHDSEVWHKNVIHYDSNSDAAESRLSVVHKASASAEQSFLEALRLLRSYLFTMNNQLLQN